MGSLEYWLWEICGKGLLVIFALALGIGVIKLLLAVGDRRDHAQLLKVEKAYREYAAVKAKVDSINRAYYQRRIDANRRDRLIEPLLLELRRTKDNWIREGDK